MTVSLSGRVRLNPASATLAAGTTNDYAAADTSWLRLTAGAGGSTLTGIVAGQDGDLLIITNVGADTLTFTHQDAGSAAANRIITATGLSVVLSTDDSAMLLYDATTQRWRQFTLAA